MFGVIRKNLMKSKYLILVFTLDPVCNLLEILMGKGTGLQYIN